jgi:DNA-binding GntR family transcriptional regulator
MHARPKLWRAPRAHEQVAEHYRGLIRAGQLPQGAELPANRRLADEWQISTSTAYKAVSILKDEGWIETRPGKPPVVVGIPSV